MLLLEDWFQQEQDLTKIDWDKQAKSQDKARLEELKKQEIEAAPKAPEQTA